MNDIDIRIVECKNQRGYVEFYFKGMGNYKSFQVIEFLLKDKYLFEVFKKVDGPDSSYVILVKETYEIYLVQDAQFGNCIFDMNLINEDEVRKISHGIIDYVNLCIKNDIKVCIS